MACALASPPDHPSRALNITVAMPALTPPSPPKMGDLSADTPKMAQYQGGISWVNAAKAIAAIVNPPVRS
jgi:hypothetical protein